MGKIILIWRLYAARIWKEVFLMMQIFSLIIFFEASFYRAGRFYGGKGRQILPLLPRQRGAPERRLRRQMHRLPQGRKRAGRRGLLRI